MARVCCLAAVDPKDIPLLGAALKGAGEASLTVVARLDIAAFGKLAPDGLIADVDRQDVDQRELLRQLRFVLPECVIVVYTGGVRGGWGRDCHLAGASCVLSKESREALLVSGLQRAMRTGCFTDPRFAAQQNFLSGSTVALESGAKSWISSNRSIKQSSTAWN